MPRSIFLAALLAGLVFVVPSAAQVGSGKIAYASGVVYTVNPDGSGRTPITGAFYSPAMAQWSPDGRRIAFTASTGSGPRLMVVDGDGSNQHEVAAGNIALWRQPWSPDSERLAYLKDNDIYTASADGGDEQRLTSDGRYATAPGWSPAGSTLVYSRLVQMLPQRWELFVVEADGSGSRQITPGDVNNRLPSWSPSGGSIAFVREEAGGQYAIYVIRPDGTDLHRLVSVRGGGLGGDPVWSPDGTQLAFTSAHDYGYAMYGWPRWLAPASYEVFSINADGSNEQRLTEFSAWSNATSPVWSPDGERILFTKGLFQNPWTMNSDGTCEEALTTDRATDQSFAPSWQPLPGGPSIGPKTCRAISVEGSIDVHRDLSTITITGTIRNEGTEPLTNVELRVSAPTNDLSLMPYPGTRCSKRYGSVVCTVPRIERGAAEMPIVLGQARRVGRSQRSTDLAALLHVSADGPLLATQRETFAITFTPRRCSARDPGRGLIEGTRFPETICGRRGADDINPFAGKDYIDAGAGPDRIYAVDKNSDVITCGPGRDRVIANAKDRVARDCELVRRTR